ncbi:MAG TPA: outer membrane lipoprotein carrier protein LolA [Candidatus Methylomirabilis sp.]|nr:outer membrane lipoprotein carrier protein LolA [Candidatus Methylomirabilis sp.]
MTRSGFCSSIGAGALLVALLWCRGGFRVAEATGADTEIQGEQRTQILQRLREQQQEVMTLRATVVQRKRHPLLKGEAISQGTLLFKRPSQVRWEVDKPERTIIVIDGHTLLIYRPDSNEAERRDLRGDVVSRGAVEFLTSGMSLDVMELEKRFQVDLYRENGRLALRLTPRSRLVARAVASVTIYQDETEAIPRQIVVVGRKDDRTETTLSQVTVNPQIPEDAFRLRLGPGVRVTDIGQAAGEGHDR